MITHGIAIKHCADGYNTTEACIRATNAHYDIYYRIENYHSAIIQLDAGRIYLPVWRTSNIKAAEFVFVEGESITYAINNGVNQFRDKPREFNITNVGGYHPPCFVKDYCPAEIKELYDKYTSAFQRLIDLDDAIIIAKLSDANQRDLLMPEIKTLFQTIKYNLGYDLNYKRYNKDEYTDPSIHSLSLNVG